MSMTPSVTVVMTAYSNFEYLPAAIESVLDQDIGDFEFILVDDGSTGDIRPIIAPYLGRLRYIRQDNRGPGVARDTGVDAAQAEFIAFCDSDDIQHGFRLSSHAALLRSFPDAAMVFSDLATFDGDVVTFPSTLRERQLGLFRRDFHEAISEAFGKPTSCAALGIHVPRELEKHPVYSGHVPGLIAARHVAWDGASMFRKSMMLTVGGHDPTLRYLEDWSFVSQLSKKYELVFWDVPAYLYRQHSDQLTKQSIQVAARSYRDVVEKVWKDDVGLAADFPQLHKELVSIAYLRNAHCAMDAGEYVRAKADLVNCIRAVPLRRHGYTQMIRCTLGQTTEKVRNTIGWLGSSIDARNFRVARRPAFGIAGALAILVAIGMFSSEFTSILNLNKTDTSPERVALGGNPEQTPEEIAQGIVDPIYLLWANGRILEAFERSQSVVHELPLLPSDDIRQHVVAKLVGFSVSLGRIEDAIALSEKLLDIELRTELQAAISFANGDKESMRKLLETDSTFKESSTALLMSMVGLRDRAVELVSSAAVPEQLMPRMNVISAMAAMQAGDKKGAKEQFEAATKQLDISDAGYFFVATDMLAGIVKSEGDIDAAIGILENTMAQRDAAVRNGSAIFWLMCQKNLAAMYDQSSRKGEADALERKLRERLILADKSFPLAQSLIEA